MDPPVAYFPCLAVYSSNCDAHHPGNDHGGEAVGAVAVAGL